MHLLLTIKEKSAYGDYDSNLNKGSKWKLLCCQPTIRWECFAPTNTCEGMGCLVPQEAGQLMSYLSEWDHDWVLLSNKLLRMKIKKLLVYIILFCLIFSFFIIIVISKICLLFQGKFYISWWNFWFIEVKKLVGFPCWGLLFFFVNLSAHMSLFQHVTVDFLQQDHCIFAVSNLKYIGRLWKSCTCKGENKPTNPSTNHFSVFLYLQV